MDKLYTEEIIPIQIGFMSLVGVGTPKDEPLSFGNYFSLVDPQNPNHTFGIRVANFWVENLRFANEKCNLEGKVKIRRYGNVCLIDDERIPKNFYNDDLCFTGNGSPVDKAILQDMLDYIQASPDVREKWESPETYYAKRGGVYKDGMVTYKPKPPDESTPAMRLGWVVYEKPGITMVNPNGIKKITVE